jgi:hypothetical protein
MTATGQKGAQKEAYVSRQRLWEIGADLGALGEAITDNGGEITPETEAKLDELEATFFEKVTRIALLVRERKLDGEKAKAEEARLAGIRKAHERTAKELLAYLERCMAAAGVDRVDTIRARVRRYLNSSPSIRWTRSLDDLPASYSRVTIAPDIDAVREDMKAGAGLPDGFVAEHGHHVRIL